jgi:RNA polymerase sigma-70 factor (ECF subfamily)
MASEEASWVARAKAGDQAAFAELFARYERRIYAFVYRMMGDADDAFDLTQETFLKAFRALGRTDAELNVNAWLHRIASNACMDVLRRRQRLRWLPWDGAKHERASSRREDDPEDTLLGDETQRAVARVLQAMSPRNRQALILREYEGLSYQEIAAVVGLSIPAVKSLLHRARQELRERYLAQEPPLDPPAGAAPRRDRAG